MAGNVQTGDFFLVSLAEFADIILCMTFEGGEGGVDKNAVGCGNFVKHSLQIGKICKRLTAGEHKITLGCDGVHYSDAFYNLVRAEANGICIFFFVNAFLKI